jgi:hypothetical protein
LQKVFSPRRKASLDNALISENQKLVKR